MRTVYLNYASGVPLKAPGVQESMERRGEQDEAALAEDTGRQLCRLVCAPASGRAVFSSGAAGAMDALLRALLRPGDRVVASCLEHPAVADPLARMKAAGCALATLACNTAGEVSLKEAQTLLTPGTRCAVLTHASHVCGTVLPVGEIGKLCRARGIFFIVDGALTAGRIPIDMQEMCIDALVVTGHKALLGPEGVGAAILAGAAEKELVLSAVEPPAPSALRGLNAALRWREGQDAAALRAREIKVTGHLLARMRELEEDGLLVPGAQDAAARAGIVCIAFPNLDSVEASGRLSKRGIETAGGLQGAPEAHRALGTFPKGLVRMSVGFGSTFEEMDYVQGEVMGILYG